MCAMKIHCFERRRPLGPQIDKRLRHVIDAIEWQRQFHETRTLCAQPPRKVVSNPNRNPVWHARAEACTSTTVHESCAAGLCQPIVVSLETGNPQRWRTGGV